MIFSRRAQTILEYTLLITVFTMAVIAMLPRIKRSSQSMIKTAADQLGTQEGSEQTFNDIEVGYLAGTNSWTNSSLDNYRHDCARTGCQRGIVQEFNERTDTKTKSKSIGAWSEE